METAQNKCIRFCLYLENRSHVGINEFKTINWLPVQNRYEECVSVSVFKFCKNLDMSDMYFLIEKPRKTRHFRYKLKFPLKSTNMWQNSASYVGPKKDEISRSLKVYENEIIIKLKLKIDDLLQKILV